jgi:hypothetical protein
MPKVVIKRDGLEIEAELTLDEIKSLAGLSTNGHKPVAAPVAATQEPQRTAVMPIRSKGNQRAADFPGFWRAISERAQKFLRIMREHEHGIEAHDLAPLLGFANPAQIGGLTGPGLTKVGAKYGIKSSELYRSEIVFPGGVRKRMFYPGKLTLAMTDETPPFQRG